MRPFTGEVVDKYTKNPILKAKVSVVGNKSIKYTDSLGKYMLTVIESGLQCYCKSKKEILIEKENYESIKISAKKESKIKLEPVANHYFLSETCIPKLDTLDGQKVFSTAEKPAEFDGGESKYHKYLAETIESPSIGLVDEQFTTFVTFIVDRYGNIRNECIYKQFYEFGLSETEIQVLKVIRKMPKWKPAIINNESVNFRIKAPIKFKPY